MTQMVVRIFTSMSLNNNVLDQSPRLARLFWQKSIEFRGKADLAGCVATFRVAGW
jgi:hypothetical protein